MLDCSNPSVIPRQSLSLLLYTGEKCEKRSRRPHLYGFESARGTQNMSFSTMKAIIIVINPRPERYVIYFTRVKSTIPNHVCRSGHVSSLAMQNCRVCMTVQALASTFLDGSKRGWPRLIRKEPYIEQSFYFPI